MAEIKIENGYFIGVDIVKGKDLTVAICRTCSRHLVLEKQVNICECGTRITVLEA